MMLKIIKFLSWIPNLVTLYALFLFTQLSDIELLSPIFLLVIALPTGIILNLIILYSSYRKQKIDKSALLISIAYLILIIIAANTYPFSFFI